VENPIWRGVIYDVAAEYSNPQVMMMTGGSRYGGMSLQGGINFLRHACSSVLEGDSLVRTLAAGHRDTRDEQMFRSSARKRSKR
jgi:hypothetical protein